MLSHKHKTIFIHIPKTAGQSVELAYLQDLGLDWQTRAPLLLRSNEIHNIGPPRLAHLTCKDYIKYHYISQEILSTYFTFSFVRNPYTRAISFYKYSSKQDKSLNEFICVDLPRLHQEQNWFFQAQTRFICDANHKLMVNYLGKFETIESNFATIASRSGLQSNKLPRRNVSKVKNKGMITLRDPIDNFNQTSLDIINEIYKDDFHNFYPKEKILKSRI